MQAHEAVISRIGNVGSPASDMARGVFRAIHQIKEKLIMSKKSLRSARMAATLSIAVGMGMAILSPSAFAAPPDTIAANTQASPSQRGVVLLVHPQKSTAAFLSILDLPVTLSDKGRFAVLNLAGGDNSAASYALVYVPPGVEVKPHDAIALESGVSDLMRQPGQAAVAMIVNNGGNLSATIFAGDVSKVVLVPAKNGNPELWIEDQHTGDVQIFTVGRGDVRIQ
jgi:hypothetical protein